MRSKSLKALLIALALVAGGMTIQQALRQAGITQSVTCDDWQAALDRVKDFPEYLPAAKVIQKECPGVTAKVDCAEMPDGSICRYGHNYKKGQKTDLPASAPKGHLFPCDASLGTPIPCVVNDPMDFKNFKENKFDDTAVLKRLGNILQNLDDKEPKKRDRMLRTHARLAGITWGAFVGLVRDTDGVTPDKLSDERFKFWVAELKKIFDPDPDPVKLIVP